MLQSASASPAPTRASALLRHPVVALVAVMLVALVWASMGFASALFTNDIVVSDEAYGLVRTSVAGPAFLLLLGACGAIVFGWRAWRRS